MGECVMEPVRIDEQTLARLAELTEQNEHSAAAWGLSLWAHCEAMKETGHIDDELFEIEKDLMAIYNRHEKRGHITPEDYAERNRLMDKLHDIIQRRFGMATDDAINKVM